MTGQLVHMAAQEHSNDLRRSATPAPAGTSGKSPRRRLFPRR